MFRFYGLVLLAPVGVGVFPAAVVMPDPAGAVLG